MRMQYPVGCWSFAQSGFGIVSMLLAAGFSTGVAGAAEPTGAAQIKAVVAPDVLLPVAFDANGKLVLPPPAKRPESPAVAETSLRTAWAQATSAPQPSTHRGAALAAYYETISTGAQTLPPATVSALMRDRIDELALKDFFALVQTGLSLKDGRRESFMALTSPAQRGQLTAISQSMSADSEKKIPLTYAGYPPGKGWAQDEMLEIRNATKAKNSADVLKWTRLAADKGDPGALHMLGVYYITSMGVKKNDAQAHVWIHRAAEKGYKLAIHDMGRAYETGFPVPQDLARARAWYETGLVPVTGVYAENEIRVRLGMLLFDGVGGPKDEVRAVALLRKAGETGNNEGAFGMGVAYENGRGVPKNEKLAMGWYQKAAAKKYVLAKNAVDRLALLGVVAESIEVKPAEPTPAPVTPTVPIKYVKVAADVKPAGEVKPIGEAKAKPAAAAILAESPPEPKTPVTAEDFFELGYARYQTGDRIGAKPFWVKAAAMGDVTAMFDLSVMMESGDYAMKADLAEAQGWAEKAAAGGWEKTKEDLRPSAELTAGRAAAKAGDWVAARKAFEKGAEAGHASALNELARLHAEGIAVLLDEKKALALYKKASAIGSSWADRRILVIEGGRTASAMTADARKQRKLMDAINGTPATDSALTAKLSAVPTQAEIDGLIKRSPWTRDEIVAAVKKGVKPEALAVALRTDGGDYYETDRVEILNLPELAGLEPYADFAMTLIGLNKEGAGVWARELVSKAVATRRAQVGPRVRPVDTAELRTRAAAGQLDALYTYLRMPSADLKLGKLPDVITRQFADINQRVLVEKFTRGYWLLASELENNSDLTKINLAQAAVYLRASAEAGEAEAAWGLAQAYHGNPHYKTNERGVAYNYLAAEHWYIEAAALAYPGQKISFQQPEDCLYLLYGFSRPVGGKSFEMFTDEWSLRWSRELIRRGGKMAEVAQLKLAGLRRSYPDRNLDAILAAIPPEVPALGAVKLTTLEAAGKRGDVVALLALGDAYATGRGLLQDDAKANDYYRQAAEKGSPAAMLRLEANYEKGIGVKIDEAQRVVWLRRASDAGELVATKKLAALVQGAEGIALYEKAVAAGDAESLFLIADIYQYGRKVPVDEAKFIDYATRAAAAGSLRAVERLGLFYSYTKRDKAAAIPWYRKSVAAGDKTKRHTLAGLLRDTGDVEGGAVIWRELAAEGDVQGQLQLGFYLQKKGDEPAAMEWFRKVAASPRGDYQEMAVKLVQTYDEEANAKPGTIPYWRKRAKGGDNDARFELARRVFATNNNEAMGWLVVAAQAGHAPSTALYVPELAKTDKAGALAWLNTQATAGNSQAIFMLGMQTATTDKPAGLALIQKAMAAGNLEAKFGYGMMQYQGRELPQDRASAITLITEAADGGFPAAQATLGKALVTGDVGIDVDAVRGVGYLKKAAEQSVYAPVAAQAALVLGQVYEQGLPPAGKPNYMEAVKFYRRARELSGPNPQLDKRISEISGKASLQMKGM